MQVIQELEGAKLKVTIKEGSVKLQKHRKEAAKTISEKREIAGYRKGSAPEDVVIKDIGEERFLMEVADIALNALLPKVFDKLDAQVVNFPGVIETVKSNDPLEVVFIMEVMPEVDIDKKKLAKIQVSLADVEVTEDEVMDEIA